MQENPIEIAEYLAKQHGIDGALLEVRAGINEALAQKDNYRLSIWRDVRRILLNKKETPSG